MRYSRLFLRAQGNHFHVVTRVVGRAFILGDREKRIMHTIMRRLEKYGGVQVLTYCLMDNHLHLLLRTEEIDGDAIGDKELITRIGGMYTERLGRELEWQLETWRKKKNEKRIRFWRERYLQRLGNLSEFMWAFKNRFTKWYNMENDRYGTLWEDRYKVVLVEGSEAVLVRIAAYIDLNPVRAGLVEDPAEYAWSGYGEACGTGVGGRQAEARRGIGRITGAHSGPGRGWRYSGRAYQSVLFSEGVERAPGAKVQVGRGPHREQAQKSISAADTEKMVAMKAELELRQADLLRQRVRTFSDGVIVGSREFVDRVFAAQPARKGEKRKTVGAKQMQDWSAGGEGLYALRDLAKDTIVKAWHRDLR